MQEKEETLSSISVSKNVSVQFLIALFGLSSKLISNQKNHNHTTQKDRVWCLDFNISVYSAVYDWSDLHRG